MADDTHHDHINRGTDRIERVIREAAPNLADRARIVASLAGNSHSPTTKERARLREPRVERNGALEESDAFGVTTEVLLRPDDSSDVAEGFGVAGIELQRAVEVLVGARETLCPRAEPVLLFYAPSVT